VSIESPEIFEGNWPVAGSWFNAPTDSGPGIVSAKTAREAITLNRGFH